MEKKTKIILTVITAVIMVVAAIIFIIVFGFGENKPSERSHADTIKIWNNCSGTLEGSLNFEVYEDSSMSKSAYNISYNISIKEGETENFVITVPESINNLYSYLYYSVTCNDNSTSYQRSGPWVNSELYEIYETGHGISWKFVSFDM